MSNDLIDLFKPRIVPVKVEFDGQTADVYVRELSARQVFDLQRMSGKKEENNAERFSVKLVSEAICDEEGKRQYSEQDAAKLLGLRAPAFNALVDAVAKATGLKRDEGNVPSPAEQTGDSSTV